LFLRFPWYINYVSKFIFYSFTSTFGDIYIINFIISQLVEYQPCLSKNTKKPMKFHSKWSVAVLGISLLLASCSKSETPSPTPPAAPVANFNYTGAGLAPATVSFTNQSTNASSYSWDFGDGGTSTLSNPSHTFLQGGVYTVRLTATGAGGSNSVSKTVNIQSPTSLKITNVKITGMPFVDPSCNCGWDSNTGPDVFFVLQDNTGATLLTGNTFQNVSSSSLPLGWLVNPAYQVTNLSGTYKILVYDEDVNDVPPNPNDYIGGYQFSFSSWATQGYPTKLVLDLPTSTLTLELTVQWL
jgi:PKD repeat protein